MPSPPRDLARALDGLVAVAVAACDAARRPVCVIAAGVVADPAQPRLTVFVPEATAAPLLSSLAPGGAVAVVLDRPATHRSVQVKGRCVEVRQAVDAERATVERCMEGFFESVEAVGVPPQLVRRQRRWPCHALTVEVEQVFEQTPGPAAGCVYTAREAS